MKNSFAFLTIRGWNTAAVSLSLGLIAAMLATTAHAEKLQSRTQNEFTATAALVNDPDWASKWSAAPPVVPNFVLARSVTRDEPATLLIFFSNPSRQQDNIQVTCEMEIRDSRRQVVARIDPTICLAYVPSSEEAEVFLFPEMELTEDHGSASGPLTLTIGVTDEVRQERIDLQLEIEVEKGGR
ncbi:MAG: hypothetical protein ABJH63_17955 [Rhizobiaceae bacterium]